LIDSVDASSALVLLCSVTQ